MKPGDLNSNPHKPSYKYLPAIDGLRFYAVLLILANHIDLNRHLEGHGLFFTLTGFLIHHITYSEVIQNKYSFKNYMARRIIRTLPLYFMIVALAGVGKLLSGMVGFKFTVNEYWKYLLVVPNLSSGPNNFILTNLWAVGVTEQFYLGWGISLLLIRRWNVAKMLIALSATYILLLSFPKMHFYGNTLVYLPNFILGALFAHFYNTFKRSEIFYKFFANKMISFAGISMIILALSLVFTQIGVEENYLLRQTLLSVNFGMLILLVCYAPANRLFISRPVRYLGKISYSFYCLHAIVLVSTAYLLHELSLSWSTLFQYLIVLLLSIFASHLSYQYFEKKVLILKRYFYR